MTKLLKSKLTHAYAHILDKYIVSTILLTIKIFENNTIESSDVKNGKDNA